MDRETIQAYEQGAAEIAARHRAITPAELHRLILGFFHAAQPTADIGCGGGRDVAWLAHQGFPAAGTTPQHRCSGRRGSATRSRSFTGTACRICRPSQARRSPTSSAPAC